MRVHYGLDDLPPLRTPVVTVGSFDGVHRGHRALLDAAVARAARSGSDSVAFTFLPHPRKVLEPLERTWLLTTLREKLWLLERSGVAHTVVMPFDREFSRMNYRAFIDRIIIGKLGASVLVVGYDHKFGHNKEGEYSLVRDSGIETIRIPEQTAAGRQVSSTEIRSAVARGDMARAAEILGHPYIIIGDLFCGQGTEKGFMVSDPDKLLPPAGKYNVGLEDGSSALLSVTAGGLTFSGVGRNTVDRENILVSFL
ncbi:MAG: FAD synthetase [Rikenellaceae bacterium]|nr:FAD synthetase [Rikenellaceae bacterium]